ncbi:putative Late nodulin [Medicago truncatula]|uniref:Nodule Cysteine-Rich (NCR) secreted peptide n=1 Tax=Medicago truncatula TaxID=3880 RepID=G7I793_MEDTR|nr:Nodule Cysteine-Rich (NCR) secreted peptide [Medicago truncatula]RHN78711.1 putative Late nodulin [Medicago truncatula]
MTEIVKFIYLMIIFLSLFIVAMNVDGFTFSILCQVNSDCLGEICLPPKTHWCNKILLEIYISCHLVTMLEPNNLYLLPFLISWTRNNLYIILGLSLFSRTNSLVLSWR